MRTDHNYSEQTNTIRIFSWRTWEVELCAARQVWGRYEDVGRWLRRVGEEEWAGGRRRRARGRRTPRPTVILQQQTRGSMSRCWPVRARTDTHPTRPLWSVRYKAPYLRLTYSKAPLPTGISMDVAQCTGETFANFTATLGNAMVGWETRTTDHPIWGPTL